jgi:hypothetical protein
LYPHATSAGAAGKVFDNGGGPRRQVKPDAPVFVLEETIPRMELLKMLMYEIRKYPECDQIISVAIRRSDPINGEKGFFYQLRCRWR